MNTTHPVSWSAFCATVFTVALFSICATAIITYVSLAVPIGPWIDPTLALVSLGVLSLLQQHAVSQARRALITAIVAGSLGGIVATAMAFSLPTLHFIDPALFATWLAHPAVFVLRVATLVLVAGGMGLVAARYYGPVLLADRTMPFPIAELVHKTVATRGNVMQTIELLCGALVTSCFSLLQMFTSWVPRVATLIQGGMYRLWRLPKLVINLDVAPMLLAIGFITGHVITIPFLAGALIKIMIAEPCYRAWYSSCVSEANFLIAFCSGLVVHGAIMSFWALRKTKFSWGSVTNSKEVVATHLRSLGSHITRYDVVCVLFAILLFCSYLMNLSLLAQIYLVVATAACVQQLMIFMGRVGLAPLGRFAFFVMVPGIFLFGFTPVQASLVAAFVEIAGGVGASAVSGYKVAQLSELKDMNRIYRYQWLALLIGAVVVGLVMYFLITAWGLGTGALVAQRAQSRALLIRAHELHYGGLVIGFVMAVVLHLLHINTTLVLGGLLTQLDWSLLLIAGGLLTYLCKDRERWYPFWSGVFTTSSLWMIARAIWR